MNVERMIHSTFSFCQASVRGSCCASHGLGLPSLCSTSYGCCPKESAGDGQTFFSQNKNLMSLILMAIGLLAAAQTVPQSIRNILVHSRSTQLRATAAVFLF